MAKKERKTSRSARAAKGGSGTTRGGAAAAEAPETTGRRFVRYCIVLALVGAAAVSWISLVSYSPTDPPAANVFPPKSPVDNSAGIVGSYLSYYLLHFLGGGAYMALLFVTLAAFILALGGRLRDVPWRILGVALLVTATSAAIYMADPANAGDPLTGSAGILGISVGKLLLSTCAATGGWIVVLVCLAMGLMLTADSLVLKLPSLGKKAIQGGATLASFAGSLRPPKQAGTSVTGATTRPHPRPPAVVTPKPAPAPAANKQAAPAPQPVQAAAPKRRNWLLRLVLGEKQDPRAGRRRRPSPLVPPLRPSRQTHARQAACPSRRGSPARDARAAHQAARGCPRQGQARAASCPGPRGKIRARQAPSRTAAGISTTCRRPSCSRPRRQATARARSSSPPSGRAFSRRR